MAMKILPFSLFCLAALLVQVYACKSDAATAADPLKTLMTLVEQALAQAETLQQQHAELQKKFSALDESLATVPAEVKGNIKNYAELEARLDGVGEKGDYRVRDLGEIAAEMKVLRDDFSAKKTEPIMVNQILVNMQPRLTEHQGAVAELNEVYASVKKAHDQVLAAVPTGGQGVTLFEGEAAKGSLK